MDKKTKSLQYARKHASNSKHPTTKLHSFRTEHRIPQIDMITATFSIGLSVQLEPSHKT
jgi:hypothetical protein